MSRVLFYMGHPAHFHNFKNLIGDLLSRGHEVKVVARGKDVLFELLENETWDIVRLPHRSGGGLIRMTASILRREFQMISLAREWKPDLMMGTDLVITHVGKILGIKSVIVNEDDSSAVPLMAKLAFPFATKILAPNCCDQSPYNHKKIGYEGYHELAYLHPDNFQPDRSFLPDPLKNTEKYFLLRFASLNAHHDSGRKGISDELALKLIQLLRPHGDVWITSERPFSPDLEPYRIPIHPSLIHHAMAFASMYIGDSQTMAAESAVLGIPSIRFNDFVGELNYLEELEKKYGLTMGIPTNKSEELLQQVKKIVEQKNLADELKMRRKRMLESTVNVNEFWLEVTENLLIETR